MIFLGDKDLAAGKPRGSPLRKRRRVPFVAEGTLLSIIHCRYRHLLLGHRCSADIGFDAFTSIAVLGGSIIALPFSNGVQVVSIGWIAANVAIQTVQGNRAWD